MKIGVRVPLRQRRVQRREKGIDLCVIGGFVEGVLFERERQFAKQPAFGRARAFDAFAQCEYSRAQAARFPGVFGQGARHFEKASHQRHDGGFFAQ